METVMQILTWLSLFVGIASVTLAGYTIWLARMTERDARQNYQRADDRMRDHYERTKEVLAAIETRSAVIEQTVKLSQDHLLNTITNLVNEIIIPKRPDAAKELETQFMQMVLTNPGKMNESMEVVKRMAEHTKATQKIDK